jgi:hypothetical protein
MRPSAKLRCVQSFYFVDLAVNKTLSAHLDAATHTASQIGTSDTGASPCCVFHDSTRLPVDLIRRTELLLQTCSSLYKSESGFPLLAFEAG